MHRSTPRRRCRASAGERPDRLSDDNSPAKVHWLKAFLEDPSLWGDAKVEEIEFLRKLRFSHKRPTPLYYYRELQNLRDPLHFRRGSPEEQIA